MAVVTTHIRMLLTESREHARRAADPELNQTDKLNELDWAASQARHAAAELEAEFYSLRDSVELA